MVCVWVCMYVLFKTDGVYSSNMIVPLIACWVHDCTIDELFFKCHSVFHRRYNYVWNHLLINCCDVLIVKAWVEIEIICLVWCVSPGIATQNFTEYKCRSVYLVGKHKMQLVKQLCCKHLINKLLSILNEIFSNKNALM